MQSYARAHTHYERQIALVMADLPYNVFSPAALKFIDDAGMKETALSAHNILDADGDYAAEVKAVQGIWPEPIQNLILDAQKKAQAASKCFTILGGQTTKSGRYSPEQLSEHWDAIRTESGGPCLKLDNHKLQTQFILAGEVAIAAMQKQLTTTQSDLTPKGIF